MSATENRIYQIFQKSNPKAAIEIKALSTTETDFVVSNLEKTADFDALIDAAASNSDFSRFNFAIGQDLTEADLVAYAELRADLDVTKTLIASNETSYLLETVNPV